MFAIPSPLLQRCRHLWLVLVLALCVFGGQVLQASPLHDHTKETVDCALCHIPTLGDDSELDHSLPAPTRQRGTPQDLGSTSLIESFPPSPYQSRAPPR